MKKISVYFILGLLALFPLINAFSFDANPSGQLRVDVVAAASGDYIKEWVSTSFKDAIHITPIKEVISDQTFYVAVIVTGYGVNDKGMTDLAGDFILQNPDGTLMFDEKNVFTHRKSMTHSEGFVMMDPAIDLTLEKKDQRGVYIFKATVKDNVLGKTISGEYSFTLLDTPK